MASNLPVCIQEICQLTGIGIDLNSISIKTVTMESNKYICVCGKNGENDQNLIIDIKHSSCPIRKQIPADSIIMNPDNNMIALVYDKNLEIYDFEMKTIIKSCIVTEEILFWKWISSNILAMITSPCIFHWSIENDTDPVKIFDRHISLSGYQITNYCCDAKQEWLALVGIKNIENRVAGAIQLYSKEKNISQAIEGHAISFTEFKMDHNVESSTLFCFAARSLQNSKLRIVDVGNEYPGKELFPKKIIDIYFPNEAQNDFPVAMQASSLYNVLYLITKNGFLHLFDIETGTLIYMNKVTDDTMFVTVPNEENGGLLGINRRGQVLSITVDEQQIIPFINTTLQHPVLALRMAIRNNLTGADQLFLRKFDQLFQSGQYIEASRVAAMAPRGILRTPDVIKRFQQILQVGSSISIPPLLQHFGILLDHGKLNKYESLELCRPVLIHGRKQLCEKWLKEEKLECSEELGDFVKDYDTTLALSIYLRANIPDKAIECFAEIGEFQKIILYAKRFGYKVDYISCLRTAICKYPEKSVNFAAMLMLDNEEPLVDKNKIFDIFMESNMIEECTELFLEILKNDLSTEGYLQTRLLKINLMSNPNVAKSILSKAMFSFYDRSVIARLCEDAGLFQEALEHYSDINDIKRLIVKTHLFDTDWLISFFGLLSVENSLECIKEILSANISQNMEICVAISTKYYDKLNITDLCDIFESLKCYDGQFCFLKSIINLSQDEEVYYKYIRAACKINQIKEVERICRYSNYYSPEHVKNLLKDENLTDQLPLIIVCDRFNFIHDLILYLYRNNMQNYIEMYLQDVNSSRLPVVIGILLDLGCSENIITNLISSVKGEFSTDDLIGEMEGRNKLRVLLRWLESKSTEGCLKASVHNALAKIYIDSNLNPEQFLKENKCYNSYIIGRYCEKRNPYLSCIAYERGNCEQELISVCNANSLFKNEVRYLVRRRDEKLWEEVLADSNPYKEQLADQVVLTTIHESQSPEDILVTVKALLDADLPKKLIELLKKIVFESSILSDQKSLQNLLILTAIKTERTRVMDYVTRLNNYDVLNIADTIIANELFEEAFVIFNKFQINTSAIKILIEHLNDFKRANDFAVKCNEPAVWSKLAEAQLEKGLIKEAIDNYIKGKDPNAYKKIIEKSSQLEIWNDLINYLLMTRKILRKSYIENELVYAYAKSSRLDEMENFLSCPNIVDVEAVGSRCFSNKIYDAAKILYENARNFASLSLTLLRLKQLKSAVLSAGKANSTKIWKEICFGCIDLKEFTLAKKCGIHIVIYAEELPNVIKYYENYGYFDELIALLEFSIHLERSHIGIFTELAILYSKYNISKMRDYLEIFWTKVNISKVCRAAEAAHLWPELEFLYDKNEDFDNAITTVIAHPTETWREVYFKDTITKVVNSELYYKALLFYLEYKPLFLNDILITLSSKINHIRVINIITETDNLHFIKPYLKHIQSVNNRKINETLNKILIEEENYKDLRNSIRKFDNFDDVILCETLEKHRLTEFRRIATYVHKVKNRWQKSIELCKKDRLFRDAMEYAAESKSQEIAEELLIWFLENNILEYFVASLYICYDLLRPDIVIELGWRYKIFDYIMPYIIQVMREYTFKINKFEERELQRQNECMKSLENSNSQFIKEAKELFCSSVPGNYITAVHHKFFNTN